ncbi:hypothetical protein SteCoe_412 [Stentor coeruleus]|uniref:Uncharacterized protein n=1 Tax=Stentor coeruleus TaxID=5963 RepID=A0A1R2D469_9CILI|nr:hypothetical protein SteCoe_412 [Stentor coeruleus]
MTRKVKIVMIKWNSICENAVLRKIDRLPYSEGIHNGTWQIYTGNKQFGKIKAYVKCMIDKKVRSCFE